MTRIDVAAEIAKRSIARTLGVDVESWDHHGRQAAHDLLFTFEGRRVACEAKRVVDRHERAAEAAASAAGYTEDGKLTRMWDVRLRQNASWKAAAREMPALLARLEALGCLGGSPAEVGRFNNVAAQVLRQLKVQRLWSQPPTAKHPPGFYLMPRGWGGVVPTMDSLPAYLSGLLASDRMASLRRQLRDADVDERHAYVFVGWEYMQATTLADDGDDPLPQEAPSLPDEITAVWLTGTFAGSRVVAWMPDRGWFEGVSGADR